MNNSKHKLLKSCLLALCLASGVAFAHGWHGGGGGWHGGGGGWHGGYYGGGYHHVGWHGGYWGSGAVVGFPYVAPYQCRRVEVCNNYSGRCWLERRCY